MIYIYGVVQKKTDTFCYVKISTNFAVFPWFFCQGWDTAISFYCEKHCQICTISSLFLVINNVFDLNPSLLDHGYHPNIKIVYNYLQHVSWNSPYFSPGVFLQSLYCVRVVIVDSPSSNPRGSSVRGWGWGWENMWAIGCQSSMNLASR